MSNALPADYPASSFLHV